MAALLLICRRHDPTFQPWHAVRSQALSRASRVGNKRQAGCTPLRVLHLPTSVGGNAQGLSRQMRAHGVHSDSLTLGHNYLAYPADKVLRTPADSFMWAELKKLFALTYVFRYDVVFFNFGRTLYWPFPTPSGKRGWLYRLAFSVWQFYNAALHRLEMLMLRVMGRTVLIQYQGDDARQGDFCRRAFSVSPATQVDETYYTPEADAFKRRQIAHMATIADKIYALNPDLLHVLPPHAEFLPYGNVSPAEWIPRYTQCLDRPLRIGHAPTHRRVKGTQLILDAVGSLRSRGFIFDFTLIEGMSNSDAKSLYENLDILVDQLFVGWYGGLAVELMALGKPAIAYLREEDLAFLPAQMRRDLPIIRTTPDTIEQTLENVLTMPRAELHDLALRSRAFVEQWHDPGTISQRIIEDIQCVRGS